MSEQITALEQQITASEAVIAQLDTDLVSARFAANSEAMDGADVSIMTLRSIEDLRARAEHLREVNELRRREIVNLRLQVEQQQHQVLVRAKRSAADELEQSAARATQFAHDLAIELRQLWQLYQNVYGMDPPRPAEYSVLTRQALWFSLLNQIAAFSGGVVQPNHYSLSAQGLREAYDRGEQPTLANVVADHAAQLCTTTPHVPEREQEAA